MNKYYVISENKIEYKTQYFKDAIRYQDYLRDRDTMSVILKKIIDIDGKEVK